MKTNYIFIPISIVLLVSACGKHPDIQVQTLTKNQQQYVQDQLNQGVVLKPTDTIPDTKPLPPANRCDSFIQSLPSDFIHDFIEVPEDITKPDGIKIKVFYYGKVSNESTPIAFFNGGPTQDGHPDYRVMFRDQQLTEQWKKLNFIYIDQRGNGCSDPYPQGISTDILNRLLNYGSRGISNDAELIRKKLIGDKPWKIMGQSFGAFIVHRYTALYAHSLVSVTAHAGVITNGPMLRLSGRIGSQNRVLESYLSHFPEDREVLVILHNELPKLTFTDAATNQKVSGIRLLLPLMDIIGFTDHWNDLHKWFQLMVTDGHVDQVGFAQYLKTYYFTAAAPAWNNKSVAGKVINFTDRNIAWTNKENCKTIFNDLANKGEDPYHWLLNECMIQVNLNGQIKSNLEIEVEKLPKDILSIEEFKSALLSNPVPFYLYSADNDPYVPKDLFVDELNVVGNLVLYHNFEGTGHDGFHTESLVWKNLLK